jgi:hypothetical protein
MSNQKLNKSKSFKGNNKSSTKSRPLSSRGNKKHDHTLRNSQITHIPIQKMESIEDIKSLGDETFRE